MTTKDYLIIGKLIKKYKAEFPYSFVLDLINVFKIDNERFNKEKFIQEINKKEN